MLKYWRIAVVLALCVYVAEFWYWSSLGFPTPNEIGEAAKSAANKNEAFHYIFSFHVALWRVLAWCGKHLLEIGTLALASFVLIQILDTRKSSERQLRAYVWVKAIELHDLQAGSLPYVVLEIRNAGQTPAHDVTIAAGSIIFPAELPINTPFPKMGDGATTTKMVLHPGAEPPFRATAPLRATTMLPQSVAEDLAAGTDCKLFVFALVKYRDAFGIRRKTYFCNSVDASAAIGATGPYDVAFQHANQHNTAT